MPDPIITSYKVYDGSNWQEYYLRTTAAAVGVTSSRKFLTSDVRVNSNNAGTTGAKVTVDSSGNGANIEIDGAHITGQASPVSGSSLQYVSASDLISAALGKLDKACKDAYDHVPANCLTYGQNGNFQTQYECLNQFESFVTESYLTGAGFIKIKATNNNDIYYELDQTTYVPTSRTVNGKALSSNVTIGATDIAYTNSAFALANTVGAYLDTLTNVLQGKQNSYAIALNGTGTGVVNGQFNNQRDTDISATFTVSGGHVTTDKYLKLTDGTTVNLGDLKVGDNVYITDQEYPDRWVSAITYPSGGGSGTITFSILETQKVVLTSYATWGNSLSHYGILDAKIENGVITLGTNTITPVTSLSTVVPYTGATGDVNLGSHDLITTGTVYASYFNGTGLTLGLHDITADNQNNLILSVTTGDFKVSAANMTLNNKNVATITSGTSAPSSPRVGDIWLDTNN